MSRYEQRIWDGEFFQLLKVLGGSHLYGLDDQYSDKDYEGIYFPSLSQLLGCRAVQKAKHEKVGQNDCTYYSLHQFMKLIASGNFKALELLFAPQTHIEYCHPALKVIFDRREEFLGHHILEPMFGFARSNISHMDRVPTNPSRMRFYEQHKYDCKHAMHSMRIIQTGIRYLRFNIFDPVIPLSTGAREELMRIRNGEFDRATIVGMIDTYFAIANDLLDNVPDQAQNTPDQIIDLADDLCISISLQVINDRKDNLQELSLNHLEEV